MNVSTTPSTVKDKWLSSECVIKLGNAYSMAKSNI